MVTCLMEQNNGMCQTKNTLYIIKGLLILIYIGTHSVTADSICFTVTISSLKNADCHGKNLDYIPPGLDTDIKVLQFHDNRLTKLKENEFYRYNLLQDIDLTRNLINKIDKEAFKGLDNLQTLDLEGNKLKEIPKLAFLHLTSLRNLNMKSNQLKYIYNDSLSSLINIQTLNFENNWIEQIDSYAFLGLNNLGELNIVGNELKTLNVNMNNTLPETLSIVRLHDNPWHCDCHLRWFRVLLESQPINWKFYHNTPECNTPPIIQGATWKQLSSDQFACAAQSNVKKNSTNIQFTPGKNMTIDCYVQGDPPPTVTWKKYSVTLPQKDNPKQIITMKTGDFGVKSTLIIINATSADVGDYKCIAQNNGGRSEVTYNVWPKGREKPTNKQKQKVFFFGVSKEVFLAVLISGGLLIVIFFIVIILCLIIKQNRQKHAYKVREYQRPSNNINKKECQDIRDKSREQTCALYQKPQQNTASISDRKFLLGEKKESCHDKPLQKVKKDDSTKTFCKKDDGLRSVNKIENIESDNGFRMKIFASYEDEENINDDQNAENNPTTVIIERQDDINNTPETATYSKINRLQRETPDLLKDRIITNRAIPVPPPLVPNHISTVHPRAKENPYVTASELKAANMKRKTASADDLLDSRDQFDGLNNTQVFKRSSSRDDVSYSNKSQNTKKFNTIPKKTRFKEPLIKPKDHASSCTNPVCLKDQPGLMNPTNTMRGESSCMRPSKPIISFRGKEGNREIDVDDMHSPDPRYDYSDVYRTMPARISKSQGDSAHKHYSPPGTSQSSPAKSPVNQRYTKPPTKRGYGPTKTVSFSEEGHPIIDLTQEMPEPIVISSCEPLKEPNMDYKPFSQGSSTMPRKPHVVHKSPMPNGSPPGKPSRTVQCTTLDDLLSPPFGQSPKSQRHRIQGGPTSSHKRLLKPGEKDEFGTAV